MALGLLPYAALTTLVLAARRRGAAWDEATVRGGVAFGVVLLLGTEALSAWNALTALPLATSWCGVLIAAACSARGPRPVAPAPADAPRGRSVAEMAAVVIVASCLALTLVVGIASAPNSWDGMTYHLPGVVHWMERRSIASYATGIDRQLWMPPLTEWLNLHSVVLAGGSDRWVALPEWTAFVGCVGLAAGLARRLGAGRAGAWVAALLVATAPTAIVQATGTKTELVGAFWVLATAWAALRASGEGGGRRDVVWASLAAGLAVATKGTGFIFTAPWLLVAVVGTWRRAGTGAALRAAAVLVMVVAALGAGIFARNASIYGDPLGDPVARRFLAVDPTDVALLASNLLTTTTLHLATPWRVVNDAFAGAVDAVHRVAFGRGAAEMQPYLGGFRVSTSQSHEAVAPSLVLFVLGLAASLGSIRRGSQTRAAMAAVWLSFALFASSIRWQPYGGRLLLPVLVGLAPLVGARWDERWRGCAGIVVATFSVLLALPALLRNDTRPMLPLRDGVLARPRASGYLTGRDMLTEPYTRLLEDLDAADCDRVALATGYDSAEYPLWALSRARGRARTFTHVLVGNPSAFLEDTTPGDVCALVVLDRPATWRPDGAWTVTRLRWREEAVSSWTVPATGEAAP